MSIQSSTTDASGLTPGTTGDKASPCPTLPSMPDQRAPLPQTISTPDGEQLALRQWLVPHAHGIVQTVHGFGEHQGVFDGLATVINEAGWSVVGLDHRAHGRSSGTPGVIHDPTQLLHDQAMLADMLAARFRHRPHVLLGTSMGGLLAARFGAAQGLAQETNVPAPAWRRPVDGLILIAPALSVQLPAPQQATLSVLSTLVPDLPVTLSHLQTWGNFNPEVLKAKLADPLIHTRLTPRVCQFMLSTAREVFAHTTTWSTPTLLFCSRADRLVPVDACERFMRELPAHLLNATVYDDVAHDLLNESCQGDVHARILAWLDGVRSTHALQATG